MTLEEISAHLEIRQVLYRYCHGIDRGERAVIASVYHPDAIDDHGAFVGLGTTFPDNVVPRMDAAGVIGQHQISNVLIELTGAVALVESYFTALNPELAPEDGRGVLRLVFGRYLDRFELRGGAWLIAHRKVIIDHVAADSAGRGWERSGVFTWGARREADAAHGFFAGTKLRQN